MKSILLLILIQAVGFARYDDTLPKGVRLMAVRQVQSDKVDEFHNLTGTKEGYSVDFKLDSRSLGQIDIVNEYVLKDLKRTSPAAYEKLVAAEYRFDVKANVNVTGIGFGYGLTNSLTVYGVIPYYRASVDVEPKRTKGNNYSEVNHEISTSSSKVGLVLDMNSLPDVDEGLVQSAVQNYYGYQALGKWEASGLGDIELGIKKRFSSWKGGGALYSLGLILPTGREDNPDIIQDVGFGTGHWQGFVEAGVGQSYKKNDFNFYTRLKHSLPRTKRLRPSSTNSDLTDESLDFYIQPGLAITISPSHTYHLTSWWQLHSGVTYKRKLEDNYESSNTYYDQKLEAITSWETTELNLGIDFSTVDAFKKKEFLAPGSIGIKVDKTLSGRNTPSVTLYSAEMRLYF